MNDERGRWSEVLIAIAVFAGLVVCLWLAR